MSDAIVERRLRPIYDYLDSGSNKKALQEADKVLKKSPGCHCAKALKALTLYRLGRSEECQEIVKLLEEDIPADDSTLQVMSMLYKEFNQQEKICEMYESALKKDPNQEELHTHLFMSYVRTCNYKKQQATALSLYKLRPKNPYYFWAVMSIVMQSHEADDKTKNAVCLPLAERMVKKVFLEKSVDSDAEMYLYLVVLVMQGKHKEVLTQLNNIPTPWNASHAELYHRMRLEVLTELKRWRELNAFYVNALREAPGEWSYYVGYVDSLVGMLKNPQQEEANGLDTEDHPEPTPKAALEFFESLRKETEERGAFLSRFLLKEKLSKEIGPSAVEDFPPVLDWMEDFVGFYGRKPCCFGDLKPFLRGLDEEGREELMKRVSGFFFKAKSKEEINSDFIQRRLLYLALQRHFGHLDKLSTEELKAYVAERFQDVEDGLHLCQGLLPTDFRPVDPFVLFGCLGLVDLWRRQVQDGPTPDKSTAAERNYLIEAIAVLEENVNRSPAAFTLKILLTRLYCLLGSVVNAAQVFATLDVKHVLIDTMSHILSGLLLPLMYPGCDVNLKGMLVFFCTCGGEVMECLISTYKFGTFHKVKEFIDFRNRLRDSLTCALTVRDKFAHDIFIMSMSPNDASMAMATGRRHYHKLASTDYKNLIDSRDFKAIVSCEAPEREIAEEEGVGRNSQLELEFVKLRDCLLDAAGVCFGVGGWIGATKWFWEEQEGSARFKVLRRISERVLACKKAVFPESHSNGTSPENGWKDHQAPSLNPTFGGFTMHGPYPARILAYFLPDPLEKSSSIQTGGKDLFDCLSLGLLAVADVDSWVDGAGGDRPFDEKVFVDLEKSLEEVGVTVKQWLTCDMFSASMVYRKQVMEVASAFCETVGFLGILAGFAAELVKPFVAPTQQKKGKKKKKEEPEAPTAKTGAVKAVESHINYLQNTLRALLDTFKMADDTRVVHRVETSLRFIPEDAHWMVKRRQDVITRCHASFDSSFAEYRRVLARKLKYLAGVKLQLEK